MGRVRDTSDWEQKEDRVDIDAVGGDVDNYGGLCIFAQPPRIRQDGAVCPRASLDLGECNMPTMNSKRREPIVSGLKDR